MSKTHPSILAKRTRLRFACWLVLVALAQGAAPRIAAAEDAGELPRFSELRTLAGVLTLDIPAEYIEEHGDNRSCAGTSGAAERQRSSGDCTPALIRFVNLTATQPRSSLRMGCLPQGDGLRGVYCQIESTF